MSSSSSSILLLIVIIILMDSLSIIIIVFLIFFKYQIYGQDDPALIPSATVETQYLNFDMAQYGPNGGIFSSPNFPNYYPQDTILFYRFIASMDYRVRIEIDFFQIRGVTPQCTHDYLDVFINVTDLEDFVHSGSNDQLLHRYCGRNRPPLLVSFTNLLILGFFTEDTQTERGFNGTFRFVPATPYRQHLQREPCDYVFNSSIQKRGEFFSSTYPGTYLPWQFCNYSFIGLPNERIHIRFRDLMLFKTPSIHHCAVDLIKLYDNTLDPPELRRFIASFRQTNIDHHLSEQSNSHHITDLCGTYTMPFDVYSTGKQLLLYFIATHYAELNEDESISSTSEKGMGNLRKGFYAEYEFLSSLTKLDFISTSKSNQYLSGTECDQTIKSFGQGYGKIQSPNWPQPYKPQTGCETYLLGLDDRYTLENVEIEFDQFDIDCNLASLVLYNASRIYDYRSRSRSSLISSHSSSINTQQRSSSSFSNYYRQELDFKANLSFCGHFKPEGRFVSKSALLKLAFLSNDRTSRHALPSLIYGGKFQARYKFVKSYHQLSADEYDGINSNACNLSYFQTRALTGKFEPPRSSSNDYFSNSNCTFNFYPINDQSRILIWYDYFNIVDENLFNCSSDNLTYSYRFYFSTHFHLHPFIYCGYRNFPSPYLALRSTQLFRIHFRSNDDIEAGLGFDGRYQFLNRSHSLISSASSSSFCRNPFDPIIDLNETIEPWGILTSDGYPENVICEWSYRTTIGFQFNLELTILELEGSKTKDPPQGCQSAVLKIFGEGLNDELCGHQEKTNFFLTNSNWFTVQFLSLTRQTKEPLRGFRLSWTVVQLISTNVTRVGNTNRCPSPEQYFDCGHSNVTPNQSMCIHRSLICDGHVQCQPISNDDELESNCFQYPSRSPSFPSSSTFFRQHLLLIIIVFSLCIIMFAITIVLIVLLIRTKRNRRTHLSTNGKKKQRRRRRRRKHSSKRKQSNQPDLSDDQDLSGINMLEQAVTTV